MSSKVALIITTINEPTEAIRTFSDWFSDDLIIVGDRKTPDTYEGFSCDYLSLNHQLNMSFSISKNLPVDHYSRKNIGYLHAISKGYDKIYETDDDNLPYESLRGILQQRILGNSVKNKTSFINIYSLFTDEFVWPRGFPLELLSEKKHHTIENTRIAASVWQGLADEDPDVDAVYRMVLGKDIYFNQGRFVLNNGTYSPFNSQNTLWNKDAFFAMYLPSSVSFRFTDILRSYIAKRLLDHTGLKLGFLEATVKQIRNPHNLLDDFESETPMYLHAQSIIKLLDNIVLTNLDGLSAMQKIYEKLEIKGIVKSDELLALEAWVSDFRNT